MLFQNIAALVAKGIKLSIQIEQSDDGKLEVSVIPTSETGKSGFSLVSKSFIATPAELDAEFPAVIAGFATANFSLSEQLASMEQQAAETAAAALEASKAAQAAKPKSPTKHMTSLPAKKAGPDLNDFEEDDEPEDHDVAPAATSGTPAAATNDPMPFML